MNGHTLSWTGVILLVLVALSTPVLSQAGGSDATIENVSYTGDAVAEPAANDTVLWRDGPHEFTVAMSSGAGLGDGTLCLLGGDANGSAETELGCRSVTVDAGESTSVTAEFDAWPDNASGDQSVRTVVRSGDDERVLDEHTVDLTVLERGGDVDEDGLANEREVSAGTDLRANDTDADGLLDGMEVQAYETDPVSNDTDSDGLLDREELRTFDTDPTVADTDGDGLDDAREVGNGSNPNVADTDRDGLDDALERNTYETNATVADTDGDGLGDGAEVNTHGTSPNEADTDGDGLADNLEVHTYGTDPSAIDTDGDGLQDGAEVGDHRTDPTVRDSDEDGLSDGDEINIYQTNPNRADTDGDGLEDGAEVDRFETDPNAVDTDGDGVSDPEAVDRSLLSSPGFLRQAAVAGALLGIVVCLGVYRRRGSAAAVLGRVVPGFERERASERDDSASDSDPVDGTGERGTESDPLRPAGDASSGSNLTGDDVSAADPTAEPAAADATDDSEEVDLDLLPNTEVVMAVLERNDGQIRQSKLVEETGWSKAKVSRVLSKMEADDEIVKVSVGRGNLITTPSDVPSGVQSPFDD